ncbi:hypothetical protein D6851_16575 [Altericroceibacterium spongiae]|uniref:Ribbon-helix-helix protein, CopG family n=1 Tax=Altericroceibacterium spongiae TaxID=2320269 RepID=A0A420EA58_9SPHN|nr:hypothetical protein [Altericroceibacterium spongiae]RKF17564.1 hypothetical protein D6851_16575 [Altericroceibacterium spongiae]
MNNKSRVLISIRLEPEIAPDIESLVESTKQWRTDLINSLLKIAIGQTKRGVSIDLERCLLMMECMYITLTAHLAEENPELLERIVQLGKEQVAEHHA